MSESTQGESSPAEGIGVSRAASGGRSSGGRKRRYVPQEMRAAFAVGYGALLVAFAALLGGIPSFDATGAWFWAGLLLVIISAAFTEPFFGTPADAVTNGSAVIVVAAAFPDAQAATGLGLDATELAFGRAIAGGYGAIALLLGLATIALRIDPAHGRPTERRLFLARLTRQVGAGRVAYSILFLLTAYAAFHARPSALLSAVGIWAVIAVIRPLEWLYINRPRRGHRGSTAAAVVAALGDPGLVSLEAPVGVPLEAGDVFVVGSSTLEILDTSILADGSWAIASVTAGLLPRLGSVAERSGSVSTTGVGYVDAGTDLRTLHLSVSPSRTDLHQGDIVGVGVGDHQVLYQVVAAQLKSARLEEDITHSRVSVEAIKLGAWDPSIRRFVPTGWLPTSGSVVRAIPRVEANVSRESIGSLPGTDLSIEPDISMLVTHGTAVLGVLGSGKSTFAHEMIRRAALADVKVLVLDTTPEYEEDLSDLSPTTTQAVADTVNEAIAGTAARVSDAMDRGGNRDAFRNAIRDDLQAFLTSPDPVRVYDLTKFLVTKQVSFRDRSAGTAGFDACTLPEVTAVIAEEALRLVKTERRTRPYLWVVLEEGHYLVPEFSSVSAKEDSKAVAQAVKVFLQGRKYGLGALLITQRTANVSKSLLTQCHTVFCFRAHDDTTAGFLSERVGRAHVAALPTLADRQMLAFGRGIRCEDPLFLRVNDAATIREILVEARSANGLTPANADDSVPATNDPVEGWAPDWADLEPPDEDAEYDDPEYEQPSED